MKRILIGLMALSALARAQTAAQTPIPAPPPPAPAAEKPKAKDTIFVLNGRTWTRDDWDTFLDSLPEGAQTTLKGNPVEFIRQLAIIDHLTKKAEAEGFLDKEPYKTRYWLERRKIVSTFLQEHTQNNTGALDEDVREFYDKNKDRFTTVTLKMIYLAQPVTGNDLAVRAKAEEVYQQALKGGDFVKLVREHSEEASSKGRDGDLGTFSKSDSLPDEVKAVVFTMKKGDLAQPIRVANGFYIFRCEEAKTEKFEDVKEALRTEVRQAKYIQWFNDERTKADVKFVRQDYVTK